MRNSGWLPLVATSALACGGAPPLADSPSTDVDVQDTAAEIVHQEDSSVGRVFVVDEGDLRAMRFGGQDHDNQSTISRSDPTQVPTEYIRLATVGLAHIQRPGRMLMIGLGGGTFTTLLWRVLPELQIDAVEISPVVAKIAREYFGVPDDPRYRIHVADGKRFLEESDTRYDLIFVDTYTGRGWPAHLATVEFFTLLRSKLSADGAAILNLAVEDHEEAAIGGAFATAFPELACYQVAEIGNLVVIGLTRAPAAPDAVRRRAEALTRELDLSFDLQGQAERWIDCELED